MAHSQSEYGSTKWHSMCGKASPAIVMQTSVVDEVVVGPKRPAAKAARPASGAAAIEPEDAAPEAAATTVATVASPLPPAATTAATPAPTTSTTVSGVAAPLKVTFPPDWGTRPVPPLPTPPAGTRWSECALHSDASWECQHP